MRTKPENFHASMYGRVLFNFASLPPDVPELKAKHLLSQLGFKDAAEESGCANAAEFLTHLVRKHLVGKAKYALNAVPKDWPNLTACNGVPGWAYACLGVELPFLSIEQYQQGEPTVDNLTPKVGDLYFKSGLTGAKDYFDERNDPGLTIGHVGLVIDVDDPKDAVICEAVSPCAKETYLKEFVYNGTIFSSAACRIVKELKDWTVLDIPTELIWRIKWSENVRWLILSYLRKS